MKAKVKNGFPPKICLRCERPFEWRKKWARDWENVKYCSEKCKSGKKKVTEDQRKPWLPSHWHNPSLNLSHQVASQPLSQDIANTSVLPLTLQLSLRRNLRELLKKQEAELPQMFFS